MNDKNSKINVISAISLLLAHFATVLVVLLTRQYIDLSKLVFFCLYGMMLCILIIIDIIFVISNIDNNKGLKIITTVISVVMIVVCSIGSLGVNKINSIVSKIIQEHSEGKYEKIQVIYSTYNNTEVKELSDLQNKIVGSLNADGVSAASLGREKLEEEKVKCIYKEYDTIANLFNALVDKEIEAAIFPAVYRTQLFDEGYTDQLDKITNIYTFEKEVKTSEQQTDTKKDLASEPFTVLLIGFAPENESGYGLTDAIILCSVNIQTMSVSMVSIPRDSYVPISCYNGTKNKINAAGANSNSCLIETIDDVMDIEADYYMKVNFKGLVSIVDALGGIMINNPVSFVGQDSASTRTGNYVVEVPAGEYLATGEQALAFARERYAMPNADFDRQLHQQQVIQEIVKSLLNLRDVNKALDVMEAAGDNFSTDISINQLTSLFNYVLSQDNYSTLSLFDTITINTSRLTGYTHWFYSYKSELKLWSYVLYEGSIEENVELLKETLEPNTKKQKYSFEYSAKEEHNTKFVYHETFAEAKVQDELPEFYPDFSEYTVDEALLWAYENDVTLDIYYIDSTNPEYDEEYAGLIVEQSIAAGKPADVYTECEIWVMEESIIDEN